MKEEFYILSSASRIRCCRWAPEADPVGIIQIIHGIKEYSDRYDDLANFFTAKGYLVIAADQPGHGKSALKEGKLGYLSGGWQAAIGNIRHLHKYMLKEYGNIPYIMYGHSMGSFMLTTYLTVSSDKIDAAILSGSGRISGALLSVGLAVCKMERRRVGEAGSSRILEKLMFGPYNLKVPHPNTVNDWICSAVPVVEAYSRDPLCTWSPSVQMCAEMLHAIQKNQMIANLIKIRKSLSILFIAGQDDPVGNYGNGVLKAVSHFRKAGLEDVTVEIYPHMRHECHNEIGKEKVYEDLLYWIECHTAG